MLLVLSDTLLNSIDEALQVHSTTLAHHTDRCLGDHDACQGGGEHLEGWVNLGKSPLEPRVMLKEILEAGRGCDLCISTMTRSATAFYLLFGIWYHLGCCRSVTASLHAGAGYIFALFLYCRGGSRRRSFCGLVIPMLGGSLVALVP